MKPHGEDCRDGEEPYLAEKTLDTKRRMSGESGWKARKMQRSSCSGDPEHRSAKWFSEESACNADPGSEALEKELATRLNDHARKSHGQPK